MKLKIKEISKFFVNLKCLIKLQSLEELMVNIYGMVFNSNKMIILIWSSFTIVAFYIDLHD